MLSELILGIVLGAVQGVAEFFPISSSGHLVILQQLAAWLGFSVVSAESIAFVVAVHGASLVAVLLVMRREIADIVLRERRTIGLLLIATVPVGVVGVLFEARVEQLFGSLGAVGIALMITGAMLILIEQKRPGERTISDAGLIDALLIGCGQAVAVMPGISRSGATISTALARGMDREQAVRFSFLMSIPAIGGVCAYKMLKVAVALYRGGDVLAGISWPLLGGGVAASFAFSLLAMVGLLRLVRRHRLSWFAAWCIPLGALVLLLRAW